MKKCFRHALVAIAFAVCGAYGSVEGVASRALAGEIGRYQLMKLSDTRLFMIDTSTGQCWSRKADGEWRDEGNPTQAGGRKSAKETRSRGPRLYLPEKSMELVVAPREESTIPGSSGTVRIRLGDVTDGQVLVSVVTDDDDYLLETTSLSQGDEAAISVGKKNYTIQLNELRNILIGGDFATFTITDVDEGRLQDRK